MEAEIRAGKVIAGLGLVAGGAALFPCVRSKIAALVQRQASTNPGAALPAPAEVAIETEVAVNPGILTPPTTQGLSPDIARWANMDIKTFLKGGGNMQTPGIHVSPYPNVLA